MGPRDTRHQQCHPWGPPQGSQQGPGPRDTQRILFTETILSSLGVQVQQIRMIHDPSNFQGVQGDFFLKEEEKQLCFIRYFHSVFPWYRCRIHIWDLTLMQRHTAPQLACLLAAMMCVCVRVRARPLGAGEFSILSGPPDVCLGVNGRTCPHSCRFNAVALALQCAFCRPAS